MWGLAYGDKVQFGISLLLPICINKTANRKEERKERRKKKKKKKKKIRLQRGKKKRKKKREKIAFIESRTQDLPLTKRVL